VSTSAYDRGLGTLDIARDDGQHRSAMSFYFGSDSSLTRRSRVALTIILAGIAILFLGNTLSEFTKSSLYGASLPSLVDLGAHRSHDALLTGAGYMQRWRRSSQSRRFLPDHLEELQRWWTRERAWIVWTLIFLVFAIFMMCVVSRSPQARRAFFAFEMAVLVIVMSWRCSSTTSTSTSSIRPRFLTNASVDSRRFPVGIYCSLVGELRRPRRGDGEPAHGCPKPSSRHWDHARHYVLFAYSTVVVSR